MARKYSLDYMHEIMHFDLIIVEIIEGHPRKSKCEYNGGS
jgi:hypothetical protein